MFLPLFLTVLDYYISIVICYPDWLAKQCTKKYIIPILSLALTNQPSSVKTVRRLKRKCAGLLRGLCYMAAQLLKNHAYKKTQKPLREFIAA